MSMAAVSSDGVLSAFVSTSKVIQQAPGKPAAGKENDNCQRHAPEGWIAQGDPPRDASEEKRDEKAYPTGHGDHGAMAD